MKLKGLFASCCVALGFLLLPATVAAQTEEFESLRASWNDGNYADVLPKLVAYWKKPGGRTWQVAFMIGTSECRIPGDQAYGAVTLDEVLASFPLPDEVRKAVAAQRGLCNTQDLASGPSINEVGTVLIQTTGGARVSGKGGYIFASRNVLPGAKITISPVSLDELRGRVLPLARASEAATAGLKRTGLRGAIAVVGPFAIAEPYFGVSEASEVGICLQKFHDALKSQFSMELPTQAVTVYAVPELEEVRRLAAKVHGIELPEGTVAYSVYEDLSIVGPGSAGQCGSLAHELVHLMIRRNFGNSPPWLEEGLASEVAVAGIHDGQLSFGPSWRDDMLHTQWNLRPTVAELVKLDWTAYVPSTTVSVQKAAATQAMAASFVRYLSSRNQLQQVYMTCQRDHFRLDSPDILSYEEILQSTLAASLARMDADFVAWFTGHGSPNNTMAHKAVANRKAHKP